MVHRVSLYWKKVAGGDTAHGRSLTVGVPTNRNMENENFISKQLIEQISFFFCYKNRKPEKHPAFWQKHFSFDDDAYKK